jgi:hypothetical protein
MSGWSPEKDSSWRTTCKVEVLVSTDVTDVAQPGDDQFLITEPTDQSVTIEIEPEVDAGDGEIKVIGVPNTKIHLKSLFEGTRLQRRDVGHQDFRCLPFHEPEGASGKHQRRHQSRTRNQSSHPAHHTETSSRLRRS